MAINGIGNNSYLNNIYGYQSSLNQSKLDNALKRLGNTSKPTTSAGSVASSSKDFIKNYNTNMSNLLKSSNSLKDSNSAGVLNQMSASSSNSDILTATNNYKVTSEKEYEVSVSQLAAAQQNESKSFNSRDLATEDINMSLQAGQGKIDVSVSAQKADGTQKTMKEVLQETANSINLQNSGVNASVVTKDGKSTLELVSSKTGKDNGFTVSGDFAVSSGIDKASQEAQNSSYTVKSDGVTEEFSSDTNKLSLEFGKITGELKKTGDATINVGPDNKKIVSAVEDLIKNYNSTVSTLNGNSTRGSGITSQIRSMGSAPASDRKMELIGITKKSDGTLSLDKDKLNEMLEKDPKLTKDIIGGQYGIAQGAYNAAETGIMRSSSSLINNDLKAAKNDRLMNDSYAFLSKYSSSSAYGMKNYYAVGMMFDSFA